MSTHDAPRRHRVFFALWPDAGVAGQLAAVARNAHAQVRGRAMRQENLHITLAFIGEVSPEQLDALRAIGAGLQGQAFALQLDRLGCWRHNRILWAGCSLIPPALADLVTQLRQSLAAARFPVEQRPFAAHVTLIRNADCRGADTALAPIGWPTSDFVLVESSLGSSGSRYVIVQRWPLVL